MRRGQQFIVLNNDYVDIKTMSYKAGTCHCSRPIRRINEESSEKWRYYIASDAQSPNKKCIWNTLSKSVSDFLSILKAAKIPRVMMWAENVLPQTDGCIVFDIFTLTATCGDKRLHLCPTALLNEVDQIEYIDAGPEKAYCVLCNGHIHASDEAARTKCCPQSVFHMRCQKLRCKNRYMTQCPICRTIYNSRRLPMQPRGKRKAVYSTQSVIFTFDFPDWLQLEHFPDPGEWMHKETAVLEIPITTEKGKECAKYIKAAWLCGMLFTVTDSIQWRVSVGETDDAGLARIIDELIDMGVTID